jgi:hypothetical protein
MVNAGRTTRSTLKQHGPDAQGRFHVESGFTFRRPSDLVVVTVFVGPEGEKTLQEMSDEDLRAVWGQAAVKALGVPEPIWRMIGIEKLRRQGNRELGTIDEEAGW